MNTLAAILIYIAIAIRIGKLFERLTASHRHSVIPDHPHIDILV